MKFKMEGGFRISKGWVLQKFGIRVGWGGRWEGLKYLIFFFFSNIGGGNPFFSFLVCYILIVSLKVSIIMNWLINPRTFI